MVEATPYCLNHQSYFDLFSQDFPLALRNAQSFLERQVKYLSRPYAKAIVTYALALSRSAYASDSNRMLRNDAIILGMQYFRS